MGWATIWPVCQYRQSFMEWLNLEGIGDKKNKKKNNLVNFPQTRLR
jgi:predicted TIM-barrel fold metal-dependent hydrolase